MIFYISDLHFGHRNILNLANRPFKSIEDMQETIIKNWNSVVSDSDEVYIIGDVFFKMDEVAASAIIKSLNGKKHLIEGNHDREIVKNKNLRDLFESISPYKKIHDNGRTVILCHYPILEWDGYFRGNYHVFGHIHNNFSSGAYPLLKENCEYFKNAFNAGVEVNNYFPQTLDQLIARGGKE